MSCSLTLLVIHPYAVYVMLNVSSYLFVPLFHSVSDAEGQMKVKEVATRPLTQDLLDHDVSRLIHYTLWPHKVEFHNKN